MLRDECVTSMNLQTAPAAEPVVAIWRRDKGQADSCGVWLCGVPTLSRMKVG
jgi:hypothetical protein